MIQYYDEGFLFSASSVVASFGDGVEVPLDNITFRSSTPMGVEWIFSTTEKYSINNNRNSNDAVVPRVVRLILISPQQDWRRNVSYAWKLDNAWMSDPDHGWIHWNSNSFVNSVIQIPSGDDSPTSKAVLTCDTMEFHFESILPSGFRRSSDPIVTNTRVVLNNVQMGSNLTMSTKSKSKFKLYCPCDDVDGLDVTKGRPTCHIVDGVLSESSSGWIPASSVSTMFDLPTIQLMVMLGLVLVLATLCLVTLRQLIQWCCHWHRTKRYQPINHTHVVEDLSKLDNFNSILSILHKTKNRTMNNNFKG
jgi:hypothetical protein